MTTLYRGRTPSDTPPFIDESAHDFRSPFSQTNVATLCGPACVDAVDLRVI
jgi:hypothetical protein